jgi:hypothetical protein
MYTLKMVWKGGPTWDPTEPGLFDTAKKKSAVEHLIETGGQTLEETFEAYSYFKGLPIEIRQEKDDNDPSINWVTTLVISSDDEAEATTIRDDLIRYYQQKQRYLEEFPAVGYSFTIDVSKN